MALSTDRNLEMMFPNVGHIIPAKSNVAGTYYKGALVDFDPNGYIVVAADAANHAFAGIVKEQVVVGAGETKDIEVLSGTLAWVPHAGAAQTDVGALFHASADDTLADGAGVNVGPCGLCVGFKSGHLLIDFSIRALS
jgi:hypothetical protein